MRSIQLRVETENKQLRAEVAALKQASEAKAEALQKGKLAQLMKQCDTLTSEITKDQTSSLRPSSVSLPVPASSKSSSDGSISSSRPMRGDNPGHVTSLGQSEAAGSRKRKTPSSQPPPSFWKKEQDISALGITPKVGKW